LKIKNKDLGHILGQMARNIPVGGKIMFKKEMENLLILNKLRG
tara:strand:+ start:476 stop:604 length:129 start_codon:yes stop_codon:yes gene_type:complete